MRSGAVRRMNIAAAAVALLALAGCDWHQHHFTNSIPFEGDPRRNPEVRVYLGIDGLSHRTVEEARRQGVFTGPEWRLAKFHTMFPGTSDASWTRILRTQPIGGYEFEHYDRESDTIRNTGILGYLCHAMPSLSPSLSFEPEYLKAFDYRANGYLHTVGAYTDTFSNAAQSFDNLFFTLAGRAQTATEFTAYLLELDVMGHMRSPSDITRALVTLGRRIEEFRKSHPERRFRFTILSDHGMDFIPVKKEGLVRFDEEMSRVGVTPVSSMAGRNPAQGPFAVTIMHTRVTYLELHTHPTLVDEVARRVSKIAAVDLAISRLSSPPGGGSKAIAWYGVWDRGELVLAFGHDAIADRYHVAPGANLARLDLQTTPERLATPFSDEELFRLTRHSRYPDLFYRVRTALAPVAVRFPADVIVSLKGGFASVGKELPGGASDLAMSAFHGALDAPGTVGTLLTDERDLPDAVRSDNFLELFPNARKHLEARGLRLHPGDSGATLYY